MKSQGSTIKFTDVHTRFGANHVHRGLTFALRPGEITTILGPSGAGKTIILKLIIGLLAPSAGSIQVLGRNILDLTEHELRSLRVDLGMLFQAPP